MAHIIRNNELVQAENASVSIHDRGFRYGDGVFETIPVAGGVPYRFEWHMGRLARGLAAIRIAYDSTQLQPQCRQLLRANALSEGLLRIQVTRGVGSRGYLPESAEPTCIIETAPLPAVPDMPLALWLSKLHKVPTTALPVRYKLCQGLNSTLARLEAADQHCADSLLLNAEGHICETSSCNVFWVKDNALFTPALECGVLEGATRAAILELAPCPVHEVRAGVDALAASDAVFITNAVWILRPVGLLKPSGLQWPPHPLVVALMQRLQENRRAYARTHAAAW